MNITNEMIDKLTTSISRMIEKHNYEILQADSYKILVSEQDKDRKWVLLLTIFYAASTAILPIYALFQVDNVFQISALLLLVYNYSPLYLHGVVFRKQFCIDRRESNFTITYFFKKSKLFSINGKLENASFKVKQRSVYFYSSLGGSTSTYQTYFIKRKYLALPIMTFDLNKNQTNDYKIKISRVLNYYFGQE